jgi:predicted acyltransferase
MTTFPSEISPVSGPTTLTEVPDVVPRPSPGRLVSLDALRGFDMFWIIGIDGIIEGVRNIMGAERFDANGPLSFIATQLTHKAWEGVAFEDLIFPLFVFIVGVSIVFSLTKALAAGGTRQAIVRIVTRSALLYLFGLLVYHGFDQPIFAFPGQTRAAHAMRWVGVLQRIAICYCVTGILFCLLRPRWLILITVVLLAGYWALLAFVAAPGQEKASFEERKNFANYLDQQFLGGYKWDNDKSDSPSDNSLRYDPEGYLSTLPAIASCLLGVFAGLTLRNLRLSPYSKFAALLVGGIVLLAAGYAWGNVAPPPWGFPIVKRIWTSSYVLVAGGYSAAILASFYVVIDVWHVSRWAAPFVWIGSNAITLYMVAELQLIDVVTTRLVGGKHYNPFGNAQELIVSVVSLTLLIALARFLYRRGVFIRV